MGGSRRLISRLSVAKSRGRRGEGKKRKKRKKGGKECRILGVFLVGQGGEGKKGGEEKIEKLETFCTPSAQRRNSQRKADVGGETKKERGSGSMIS